MTFVIGDGECLWEVRTTPPSPASQCSLVGKPAACRFLRATVIPATGVPYLAAQMPLHKPPAAPMPTDSMAA